MKHIILLILTATFLTACEQQESNNTKRTEFGSERIEQVAGEGEEVTIPYEKWELPNGLTLIVHEDHSDPIVHVDVTYHVGSAREQLGRSGFAHFFEHMMFQGSDHVADEEHIKIVQEAGGSMNGTTNTDRTNYFETLPSNQLEVGLWLEADRMGYFLDAVTQRKFEVQRATVKNERNQRYDNRPYGLVWEKVGQALYPFGHPYSWPTIGYINELNWATLEDLKNFFLRWYGPNNATLTIAGDVDPEEVVALTEKYFGPIPKGPQVEDMAVDTVNLEGDRYISYEDNVHFPMIKFAYPTVPIYHPDEAPLDVLSEILGGGKSSIFYQKFIKTEIANRANASNPCRELAGQFEMTVMPYPGHHLADIDSMIRAEIEAFEDYEITDDDLQRFKSKKEAQTLRSIESVNGKARLLAQWETFTDNPDYIQQDLQRYRQVTKEDVKRVFNKYIKGENAVILSVYPKGQPELKAAPDNFEPRFVDSTHVPADSQFAGLTYEKGEDEFDRSIKPEPTENPTIQLPEYWTETFDNGLEVIGAQNEEVPTFAIRLAVKGGHRLEPREKAGIANLTANLMTESTENYTTEELANELEILGSRINATAQDDELIVNVSGLTKNLEPTLELMEEVIFRPRFSESDFKRLKNKQLEDISDQQTKPWAIAANTFERVLHGEEHIMSLPVIGTSETVGNIELADVKEYYEQHLAPNVSRMVIIGDVQRDEVLPEMDFLRHWEQQEVTYPTLPETPDIEETKLFLVNREGAPQSMVLMGCLALPYDATGDFYRATLMNFSLGGSFTSRINLNLREDKGWTYGARSSVSGSEYPGAYRAGGAIKGNATDSAVMEIMKEIKSFAEEGITPEELKSMRISIGQQDALKYETNRQKAGFMDRILKYDLPEDFLDKQDDILANITKEEIDALAKKYLPYDQMAIVVVGDKASIYDDLSELGYEIVELEPEI